MKAYLRLINLEGVGLIDLVGKLEDDGTNKFIERKAKGYIGGI